MLIILQCGVASYNTSDNNQGTSIADVEQVFSAQYNHLRNKKLNQNYVDFSLVYHNYDITTVRYLQDNNKQGIKIENVLAKYLVVENRDLKELLSKLGIKNIPNIPDTIPDFSINNLIMQDKEKINFIVNEYSKIFTESLNEKNFKKIINEDKSVTISLVLSENEVAEIIEEFLVTLKSDNETLNYIISKANSLGYKLNIDSFKTYLQENIDEINSKDYPSKNEFVKVALTSKEGRTDNIYFKIILSEGEEEPSKEYAISINIKDKNNIIIDINKNNEKYRVNLVFECENNEIATNIETFALDENTKQLKNLGKILHRVTNYNSNRINQNIMLMSNDPTDNSSMNLNISNTILLKQDVEIEKINEQNSQVINDMSKDEIQGLLKAIVDRMDFVFGDKLDIKSFMINTN